MASMNLMEADNDLHLQVIVGSISLFLSKLTDRNPTQQITNEENISSSHLLH